MNLQLHHTSLTSSSGQQRELHPTSGELIWMIRKVLWYPEICLLISDRSIYRHYREEPEYRVERVYVRGPTGLNLRRIAA